MSKMSKRLSPKIYLRVSTAIFVCALTLQPTSSQANIFDCILAVKGACVKLSDHLFVGCTPALAKKTGREFIDYFSARSELGKRKLISGLSERLSDQSQPSKVNFVIARQYLNLIWQEDALPSQSLKEYFIQNIMDHALPSTSGGEVRLLALDFVFSLLSGPSMLREQSWRSELNQRLKRFSSDLGVVLPDLNDRLSPELGFQILDRVMSIIPKRETVILDRYREQSVHLLGRWLDAALSKRDPAEFRSTLTHLMALAEASPDTALAVYYRLSLLDSNKTPSTPNLSQHLSRLRTNIANKSGTRVSDALINYRKVIDEQRARWPADWYLGTTLMGSPTVTDRTGSEIGYLSILKTDASLTLTWMETSPDFQKNGIGTALIATMMLRHPKFIEVYAELDKTNRSIYLIALRHRPDKATPTEILAAVKLTPLYKSMVKLGLSEISIEDTRKKFPSFKFSKPSAS